jgi:adenylate cyclase
MKKIFRIEQIAGLLMLLLLLFVFRTDPIPVQYVREKCFDMYQILKPRTPPAPEDRLVLIVDIDEKSLQEYGQWPWSRKVMAGLVANLHNMGVGVVAFDMVFSEPDRLNPARILDSIESVDSDVRDTILALESNDAVFADILAQTRVVLGRAGFWDQRVEDQRPLPPGAIAVRSLSPEAPKATDVLVEVPALIHNLALLEKNASGIGTFAFRPMLDGIIRQIPLVTQHKGLLYPSLAVEALRVGLQVPTLVLEVAPYGINGVAIAPKSVIPPHGLEVPTDDRGQVRPYFAPHDMSIYLSASDILKGRVDPSRVAGKIAFVGSSAAGLLDVRSTPVSSQIPGVEVHAQVLENMLAIDPKTKDIVAVNHFLSRSQFVSKGGELILIAGGGLLMILFTPLLGATRSMLFFLLLTCGAMAGSWYLFAEKGILMDATFAVFTSFILYASLTYLCLNREEGEKRYIRSAFAKYLSPAMVDVVAEHPEQLKLGGQSRDMTLLFCDVRGFTTISEQFSAEGLTRLINALLSPLTEVILKNGGTVDKYMGDCIMAFWNAPLDDAQHARNGCLSALQMIAEMDGLNDRLKLEAEGEGRQHIELKVGLGLNSGECVVGNMGSDQRFDYSVLGDAVNMASRLEGQSKTYGVPIVIGEETRKQVPELATMELDIIRVKGKTQAVRIFALLGDEEIARTDEFKALEQSVETLVHLWRTGEWSRAQSVCRSARKLGASFNIAGFFDLYDERLADFSKNPPEKNWDGVFVATTK